MEPILEQLKKLYEEHLKELNSRKRRDLKLEGQIIEDLLDINVLDPALGSGHFLVSAVDHIKRWVIERLNEHTEAPLALDS